MSTLICTKIVALLVCLVLAAGCKPRLEPATESAVASDGTDSAQNTLTNQTNPDLKLSVAELSDAPLGATAGDRLIINILTFDPGKFGSRDTFILQWRLTHPDHYQGGTGLLSYPTKFRAGSKIVIDLETIASRVGKMYERGKEELDPREFKIQFNIARKGGLWQGYRDEDFGGTLSIKLADVPLEFAAYKVSYRSVGASIGFTTRLETRRNSSPAVGITPVQLEPRPLDFVAPEPGYNSPVYSTTE